MTRLTRRDFVNGAAVTVAAGSLGACGPQTYGQPGRAAFANPGYYPPELTGLRGTHDGAFEVAHALAREGKRFDSPTDQTDDTYDLVVVGGGLSGLSAAWYFREEAGNDAKILILDNHDDFGGHAKRLEFNVDGRQLISYGGSQTIDDFSKFPEAAQRMLRKLGFRVGAFDEYFDLEFYETYMTPGWYFDGSLYGESRLVESPISTMHNPIGIERDLDHRAIIEDFPLSAEAKQQLTDLFTSDRTSIYSDTDSVDETILRMATQSYEDFVRTEHGLGDEACGVLRNVMKAVGLQLGLDAVNVITVATFHALPAPGMTPELLSFLGASPEDDQDRYIHHFPGGNSAIARMIVRDMIPEACPGSTQEDLVLGRFDYGQLDTPANSIRVRLNSTAVNVQHAENGDSVDVTYVKDGRSYRVRARHTILACYNNILPSLCPEMEQDQRQALRYASKNPFAWTQVALRNWRPIEQSGFGQVFCPGEPFISEFWMDFPVSMGGYQFPKNPDEPMVVTAFPILGPDQSGLAPRDQFRMARMRLLEMPFSEFEDGIVDQLDKVWGPFGMDAERDVAAITVNRWSHGYAYAYDPLWDPLEYDVTMDTGPHVLGRRQMNRISVANSDAAATPLAQAAIDQGYRAVQEQIKLG